MWVGGAGSSPPRKNSQKKTKQHKTKQTHKTHNNIRSMQTHTKHIQQGTNNTQKIQNFERKLVELNPGLEIYNQMLKNAFKILFTFIGGSYRHDSKIKSLYREK